MKSHQTKAAQFAIAGFSLIVLAISASTSFGFFYNFFDALLPPELLGPKFAAFVSGAVGIILFDVACSIWLLTFLNHAETPEQRAITLIMTSITFIGSASASVAHLGLTASGELAIEESMKGSIALVSLVVVILGVIANFGAALAYQRFSADSKQAVRESDRRDLILKAKDEHAKSLDQLVQQKVREMLTKQAPAIARVQADRLAAEFYRTETQKYGSADMQEGATETAVPPTPEPGQSRPASHDYTENLVKDPRHRYEMQMYQDGKFIFVADSNNKKHLLEKAKQHSDRNLVLTRVLDRIQATVEEMFEPNFVNAGHDDFLAENHNGNQS